jgi:AcrR family transcriptional regulator
VAKRPKRVAPRGSVTAATRERILAGAAKAFGELGYSKVRVEDILLAAEISRPTFYKVYRTKDAVFEALSDRHHREIRERVERAAKGASDPIEQMAAMVDAFLQWRAGLGAVGRVLDLEARTPGSRLARHRRATLRAVARLSEDQLKAAGRSPVDPVLVQALIAAMESVADSLLADGKPSEAVIERARRNAFRVVASVLGAPGDPMPPLPPPPE